MLAGFGAVGVSKAEAPLCDSCLVEWARCYTYRAEFPKWWNLGAWQPRFIIAQHFASSYMSGLCSASSGQLERLWRAIEEKLDVRGVAVIITAAATSATMEFTAFLPFTLEEERFSRGWCWCEWWWGLHGNHRVVALVCNGGERLGLDVCVRTHSVRVCVPGRYACISRTYSYTVCMRVSVWDERGEGTICMHLVLARQSRRS